MRREGVGEAGQARWVLGVSTKTLCRIGRGEPVEGLDQAEAKGDS